jgi:hypothetical protein
MVLNFRNDVSFFCYMNEFILSSGKKIFFRIKADLSKNDENITIFVDFSLVLLVVGKKLFQSGNNEYAQGD